MQVGHVNISPYPRVNIDPRGFLSSLGIKDTYSMVRDDMEMARLLKPKLAQFSGLIRFAQRMNPFMLAGRMPPSDGDAVRTSELEDMFSKEDHAGLGNGKDSPPAYGTYAIAMRLGFAEEQARRIAVANAGTDRGIKASMPLHSPSRHFNSNLGKDGAEDSRITWARYHLERAIELKKSGRLIEAEKELGYGLHSLQDAFAHAQISPLMHVAIGRRVDSVVLCPVAVKEAVAATEAYLKSYINAAPKRP